MKVAIYVRVSKGDLNPENQKLQLIDHAKHKGWTYDIFEETESTRKTRPIKEKLLQEIREGKYDGVNIYKLDRWARSLQELIMNVTEITNRGKQFIVLTQPFDTTSSAGMLMMQILGAFAEFEREIIRERTKAGLERASAQGKIKGRHPADCGCGIKLTNGKRHNGKIKPIRDQSNRIIGWEGLEEQLRRKKRAREQAKEKDLATKCENCGSCKNLERHHPDYNFPSKFKTLCKKCHTEEEKQTPPREPIDFTREKEQ